MTNVYGQFNSWNEEVMLSLTSSSKKRQYLGRGIVGGLEVSALTNSSHDPS